MDTPESPETTGNAGVTVGRAQIDRTLVVKPILSMVSVFISHSSKDQTLVEQLIRLLRSALPLRAEDIRATSVDGFRLPGGSSTDESLRLEVNDAKVLIGLISQSSIKSAYVVFELGARWGSGKPMVPLLAPDLDPDLLEGPLKGINALCCRSAGQLHQLVKEISGHLNAPLDQPAAYQSCIDEIIALGESPLAYRPSKSVGLQKSKLEKHAKGHQAPASLQGGSFTYAEASSIDGTVYPRRLLRGPKKWKQATWAAVVVAALTWIGRLYLGAPSAGATLDGPLGIRFRYVPSGTYRIGEQDESDATSHSARLTRGFWLAETELTQAQWSRLVSRQPSTFVGCGGDCPVETVNWYEVVAFGNRLSDRHGLARCYKLVGCHGTLDRGDYTCESVTFAGLDCPGYRLPTAAEWEVAARAGTTTAIYTGYLIPLNNYNAPELDPIAWYFGNSGVSYAGAFDCSKFGEKRQYAAQHCGPHPVGQKQANAWGFRDLLGNVKEWGGDGCCDYPSGMLVDPFIPPPNPTSTLCAVKY